jgi:hypothetical protein
MTSRRDYIATSAILRASKLSRKQRDELAARFADYFERDNPRFDRARFLEAADATDWAFLGRPDSSGLPREAIVNDRDPGQAHGRLAGPDRNR